MLKRVQSPARLAIPRCGPSRQFRWRLHQSREPRWKGIAVGAAAALALVVAGWIYNTRRAHALTQMDTVVLADFINKTGDPIFDDTLRQGLAAQLQQSPFLSLVPEQRIQQTLRLMGKPTDTKLTPAIAGDVCQRAGAKRI